MAEAQAAETVATTPATLMGGVDIGLPSEEKVDPATDTKSAAETLFGKDGEQKAEGDKVEEKPAEGDKVEEKKDDKAEDKPAETVDLSDLKLPENFKADPEVMGEFTKLVNDQKMTKEQAQALAPLGAKIAENAVKQITEGFTKVRSEWRDQVKADPTIGTKEQMAIANKGLTVYGTPELRNLLDTSGMGDHPEVIKLFHKLGKQASEDNAFERGGSGAVEDAAKAMYPSMKH